ncbi:ATP-dependent endonuclease [Vibrio cyclitrophicus]
MSYTFNKFEIKRFRSVSSVSIDMSSNSPVIICGENNIGKTNVLNALNLFFNHFNDLVQYDPNQDLPHHISYGSGGGASSTELIGHFSDKDYNKIEIVCQFKKNGDIKYSYQNLGSQVSIKYVDTPPAELVTVISFFKFMYIQSNNIDIPELISSMFSSDGLLKLDSKRSHQTKPLKTLRIFQQESQKALESIEKELNKELDKVTDISGIKEHKPKIKISFAKFEKLRHIISQMTEVTFDDGNDLGISSKGSGIQRLVLISLMNYIANNYSQKIIWGLDEPEVFLQPKLQKQLFESIKTISSNSAQVIITTHSPHFIDLNNLQSTYLFTLEMEEKEYGRVKGKPFFKKDAKPVEFSSDSQKAKSIRQHLGIENNDGWSLLPYNLLVEGESDKAYLESLFKQEFGCSPNIIWAGGASKMVGYIRYYDSIASETPYKPKIVAIFDNDSEGRDSYEKIKPTKYQNITLEKKYVVNHKGHDRKTGYKSDWEIEDFVPPELMFDAADKWLRKRGYAIISKPNRNKRDKAAYKKMQILDFIENMVADRNPDQDRITFNSDGVKRIICQEVVSLVGEKRYRVQQGQLDFLTQLND